MADDDLLAKLGGGCCPLLEHLDVHGSWEVTNQVRGPRDNTIYGMFYV